MDEWHKQRAVQSDPDASLLDLGFSTFFLNRTNRSGIVLGGVIGGKEQTGQWKIDARYNISDLVRRIERIASYRSRISLYNLDAADLIRDILPTLPRQSLVYLDPPYYVKGKGLYENHYTHSDHAKIAELVATIQQKWIVTYDNVEPIRTLYSSYHQEIFGLRYSAGSRYEGKEVMVYCDDLKPVDIKPSRGAAA
jgi:DNA adenine methylase